MSLCDETPPGTDEMLFQLEKTVEELKKRVVVLEETVARLGSRTEGLTRIGERISNPYGDNY